MIKRYHEGKIPEPVGDPSHERLKEQFAEAIPEIEKLYGELAYNRVLERIWRLVDAGNKWIDEKAPWNLFKTEEGQKELAGVMYHIAECLRALAILIYPCMPHTAEQIFKRLNASGSPESLGMASILEWNGLQTGAALQPGEQLFPRIDEKREAEINKTLESAQKENGEKVTESATNLSTEKEAEAKKEEPKSAEENGGSPIISFEDVMKLDLRVGTILEAEKVKKSKNSFN